MRWNLLIFSLLFLLAGCVSDVVQFADDMKVKTRIGVLADTEVGKGSNLSTLEKAFVFYRQQKVDAVVLTGAITQNGNSAQVEALNQVWEKVFKGSTAKLITDEGRHEVKGFAFATSAKRPMKACEILTFYGNRKLPLTDELCFYPRESKAICAGSMHGVNLPEGIKDEALRVKASKAAQGLLVCPGSTRIDASSGNSGTTDRFSLTKPVSSISHGSATSSAYTSLSFLIFHASPSSSGSFCVKSSRRITVRSP